jgi:hypothetical protein
MTRAFERERREIRAVIDAEIRSLRDEPPASLRQRRLPVLAAPAPGASVGTGLAHAHPTRPPPSGRRVVSVALLVCCLLAVGIYSAFPAQPRRPPARAPSASLAASDAPPAPPLKVRLRLTARPASASFVLDDVSFLPNPYEAEVPSDGFVHRIVVSADGYETRRVQAGFDRDIAVDVTLAALPPTAPSVGVVLNHPAR